MKNLMICSLVLFQFSWAFSQIKNLNNDSPYPTKYTSLQDQSLTLKSVTVVPSYDNVGGVYKKAAEETLEKLISNDQFWSFEKIKFADATDEKKYRIDLIEDQPEYTLKVLKSSRTDALFSVSTTKSPQGLQVRMTIYTADGGLPLIQETYEDTQTFEINKYKEIIEQLYRQIKNKLPYKALIASRRGQKVTLNSGKKSGLKIGDKLSVAQILKIQRHPKLKFMIGTEKEIIGQVVLTQVEDDLSFGEISFEKESGVIEKNSKLLPFDPIKYNTSMDPTQADQVSEQAEEWRPLEDPQFGKIHLLGGFTNYKLANTLVAGSTHDSGNSLAPTFALGGQIWITPEYFADLQFKQMFFKGNNSLSNSYPDSLNFNVSETNFVVGYKYAIDGNFWGPSLNIGFGHLSRTTSVTDSTPTAFTSFEFSGLHLQAGAYFPLTLKNDFGIGAQAQLMLTKRLSEMPVDSGPSSNNFVNFDFYGIYAYSNRINFRGQLTYSDLSSSLEGTGQRTNPARSMQETITSYLFGIEYQF